MANYRPRGNKSKMIIGKAVGMGISAAHRQKNSVSQSGVQEKKKTKKSNGEMLFSIISCLLFLLIIGLISQ